MMSAQFEEVEVILNRFFVKTLNPEDLTFHEYQCQFTQAPEQGSEQKALSSVCYKLGVTAVRLGNRIITREPIDQSKMKTQDWQLQRIGSRQLSCQNNHERQALESFERKILERKLKGRFKKTTIEKDYEVGLIWWISGEEGVEKSGDGWQVHRGREINLTIDTNGKLYLEIDIHHRFYTPKTLEWWLTKYPDIQIRYVRNTYEDKQKWILEDFSEKSRDDKIAELGGKSLAEYHREKGATAQEINQSRVVIVRKTNDYKAKPVYHLSGRLSPSLTMDMLAQIAKQGDQEIESKIQGVFNCIKKDINLRLQESQKTARVILQKIYNLNLSDQPQPTKVQGFLMPRPKLLAGGSQEVDQTSKIRHYGCAKTGETKFGCLNLFNDKRQYPEEVRKCLLEIAQNSSTQIEIDYYCTKSQYPEHDLGQKQFWRQWAGEGIKTVLVVMPWLPHEHKTTLRKQALEAGIATQFMIPTSMPNDYKALNVCLGLLCKAKWQPVFLKPLENREAADLVIGFDTGTNRELYYGTSAFAVLANGQSLGWELPDVQRGETFSSDSIWGVVSKLVLKYQDKDRSKPKKILLMRDGLVQEGEFEKTIEQLRKEGIAVDILSVRKSGSGRMGRELDSGNSKITYRDAKVGTVILDFESDSFILQSSEAIQTKTGPIGSARPLRVVRYYGKTPLELLALQTYHLTQLHPASGFRSCRLPWVLHLADRSSKEFQRIGQISVLANIDREKLIAV
ncbi:argonaute PAZ domain-containing protein [Thermosynechococcus sp.]|uniref:argonaute PAZ domain-containing protein n=1 Tax=Thermosynechococcus sp. TaxID=2814275 RepID=UPI00391C7B9C